MEHPVTISRRKTAARLEAEIFGNTLPTPWMPQPKSRIERAIGRYVRGNISRKELRCLLVDIKAGLA